MKLLDPLLTDLIGRRQDCYGWRSFQMPLDLSSVQNVCLLHLSGKLGDAIMISLAVDALAKSRPGLSILVGTTPPFAGYWQAHPRVQEVLPLPRPRKIVRRLAKTLAQWSIGRRFAGRIDVLVSFKTFNRPDHFALVRGFGARTNVGFNKLPYRLFHRSLDEGCHGVECRSIAARTSSRMRLFGLDVSLGGLSPHLPFGPDDELAVRSVVERFRDGRPRLLLNVYGASGDRRLSPAATLRCVAEIRKAFDGPIFVSVPKGEIDAYEGALSREQLRAPLEVIGPRGTFGELFALVAAMDAVVSPDTAIGHVAAAFAKPQVALFSRGGNIPVVWKPLNARCESLVSKTEGDVNGIDWDEFGGALRRVWQCAEAGPSPRQRVLPTAE